MSPASTKNGSTKFQRIYPSLIEATLKTLALKSGLVSQEELEIADFNPVRPHALRTAFVSILKNAGANNSIVEYLCGHTVSPTEKAYLNLTPEELQRTYLQFEKHLSISGGVDNGKLQELEKKAGLLEQDSKTNQGVISALLENGRNKDLQLNNVTNLLSQVQESLNRLDSEMTFHRLEDIARFVAAKAPTKEEMANFLNRRGISQSILQKVELQCITFSNESGRWVYTGEDDSADLLSA